MKVETSEYLNMLSRMIRAAGRRVADADEHELSKLIEIRDEFDRAIQTAVAGQVASGRSWSYIGQVLGMTKQGAYKRYGTKPEKTNQAIA